MLPIAQSYRATKRSSPLLPRVSHSAPRCLWLWYRRLRRDTKEPVPQHRDSLRGVGPARTHRDNVRCVPACGTPGAVLSIELRGRCRPHVRLLSHQGVSTELPSVVLVSLSSSSL